MKQEQHIQDEVERSMRSLDDLPPLRANPFLATRILAAIAAPGLTAQQSLAARLRVTLVGLGLLIALNVFSALYFMKGTTSTSSRAALISSLDKEYNSTTDESLLGN